MKLTGYWFCEGRCDDTVTLPPPTGRGHPGHAVCPQCHQTTAVWHVHAVVHRWPEHEVFEEMRRTVNAA